MDLEETSDFPVYKTSDCDELVGRVELKDSADPGSNHNQLAVVKTRKSSEGAEDEVVAYFLSFA